MIAQRRDIRDAIIAFFERRSTKVAVILLEETATFVSRMTGFLFDLGLKVMQCASIFYLLLLLGHVEIFAGIAPSQLALLRAWGGQWAPEVHLLFIWCGLGIVWILDSIGRLAVEDAPKVLTAKEKAVMRRFAAQRWTLAPLEDCWLAIGPNGEEVALRRRKQVMQQLAELEGGASV